MALTTSAAVTPREASLTGSIHTRIEYCWAPKILTSATPSTVVMRGRTTRSMYSVSCSLVMFGFCIEMYIIAKESPVPLTMTGSLASEGRSPRTPYTFDSTSASATSGLAPSFILTVTVLAEGALDEVT